MRFFFLAEDGIRCDLVTGVQTCALPTSRVTAPAEDDGSGPAAIADLVAHVPHLAADALAVRETEHLRLLRLDARSEERRVGKECLIWGWLDARNYRTMVRVSMP